MWSLSQTKNVSQCWTPVLNKLSCPDQAAICAGQGWMCCSSSWWLHWCTQGKNSRCGHALFSMWGVWMCCTLSKQPAATGVTDLWWSWWRPPLLPGWAAEGRANAQPVREGGAKATSQWASAGGVCSKRHTSVLFLSFFLNLFLAQVD